MAPLEPWEKVLINARKYTETVHGYIACQDCHGGVQSADKDSAHEGLVARPSEGDPNVCSDCHPNVAMVYGSSLHATMRGYWTVLDARSAPEHKPAMEEMFGNHCAGCHTTCGDCHVSQPHEVGGGFLDGHVFMRTPPMTRTCTACHGSRVGNEYLGKNDGFPGDVHFRQGRMNCISCHSGAQLHGEQQNCQECHSGPEAASFPPRDHRYDGIQNPSCVSCHPTVTIGKDDNEMHLAHRNELSCQVCHSITYTNCDGCHVAISDRTGNPFFRTEATYFTFLIGLNPNPTMERPYKYVPLRHIPATPGAYDYYGENLLPNFNLLPTWVYATPHNIQLNTPQNETCNACHGNPDLFLTIDKVKPEELEANLKVIVPQIPPALEDQPEAPGDETSSP